MTKRKDDNKDGSGKNREPATSAETAGAAAEAPSSAPPAEAQPIEPAAVPTPEQVELAELRDRLLRLQADFDNFRKRTFREREEFRKLAAEAVMTDLITAMDHLDYGLNQAREKPDWASYAEGLRLIRAAFSEVLRKHGLEEVATQGRPFDPQEHEAIAHTPSTDVSDGMILAETRKGYRLGDRLLRAASVVVSSGPAADAAAASGPAAEGRG